MLRKWAGVRRLELVFMHDSRQDTEFLPLEVIETEGGLYVTSADIPGFHMFNKNAVHLIRDIPSVAKLMLKDHRADDFDVSIDFDNKPMPAGEPQAYRFLKSQPKIMIHT